MIIRKKNDRNWLHTVLVGYVDDDFSVGMDGATSYASHLSRPHGVVHGKRQCITAEEANGAAGIKKRKYVTRLFGSKVRELDTYLIERLDLIVFGWCVIFGYVRSGHSGREAVRFEHRIVGASTGVVAYLPTTKTSIGRTSGVWARIADMAQFPAIEATDLGRVLGPTSVCYG